MQPKQFTLDTPEGLECFISYTKDAVKEQGEVTLFIPSPSFSGDIDRPHKLSYIIKKTTEDILEGVVFLKNGLSTDNFYGALIDHLRDITDGLEFRDISCEELSPGSEYKLTPARKKQPSLFQ